METQNIKAIANLKTGNLELFKTGSNVNDLEMESLLASVFSVAVLHVMLQPAKTNTKNLREIRFCSSDTMDSFLMMSLISDYNLMMACNFHHSIYFDGCFDYTSQSGHDNGYINDGFDTNGNIDAGTDACGGCGGCGGSFIKFIFKLLYIVTN